MEKEIKVSEAAKLFAHASGKDANAFYKQVERGRYESLATIDGVQYVSVDELYANLPIDENGEKLLPVNTVARNTGINSYEIKANIKNGTIPVKIIGSRSYINPKDVEFLLKIRDITDSPDYVPIKKFAMQHNLSTNALVSYAAKAKFETAVKVKNQWFVKKDDPFIKQILNASIPENYISIDEYATLHHIEDKMKVTNDVRRGLYKTAILVNLPTRKEKWFLHKDDISVVDSLTEQAEQSEGEYLTVEEISEKYGIKKSTIIHKIHNGKYPSAKKIGIKWYVNSIEAKPLHYGLVTIKTYSVSHNMSVSLIRKRIQDGRFKSAIRDDGIWYLDNNEIIK